MDAHIKLFWRKFDCHGGCTKFYQYPRLKLIKCFYSFIKPCRIRLNVFKLIFWSFYCVFHINYLLCVIF